jgi:hypothetical protein
VTEDMKIKTMHYQRTKLASQKNPTNQLKEEAFFLTKMFLHFFNYKPSLSVYEKPKTISPES